MKYKPFVFFILFFNSVVTCFLVLLHLAGLIQCSWWEVFAPSLVNPLLLMLLLVKFMLDMKKHEKADHKEIVTEL